MKIFLAGATGAIGRRLLPLLTSAGHHVVGATRTKSKTEALRAAGAEPVVFDALDRDAVMQVIGSVRPDTIVHQMTALAGLRSLKNFDHDFALTNRLRTEGTRNLLAAARAMGARRFVAQSYAGWPNIRQGGRVKTEDDPLDPHPPQAARRTFDAIRQLEATVTSASGMTGIVLRYGSFYGPGTSFAPDGDIVQLVRRRRFPVFDGGAGVWSFIHIDDAAAATALAIERGPAGIYNVVDDEPAEVSVWLPELAKTIGAKPPYRLPAWIGRMAIGDTGMSMMTRIRGSSNEKAKHVLGWRPVYPSWRDGFRAMMAPSESGALAAGGGGESDRTHAPAD